MPWLALLFMCKLTNRLSQSNAFLPFSAQIEFEDVSYTVDVPVLGQGVPNIGSAIVGRYQKHETATRSVLSRCSGVLSPSTLTLVRSALHKPRVVYIGSF